MLEDSQIIIVDRKKISEYEMEYRIGGIQGDGVMSCIDVYYGIQVIYNKFHSFDTPINREINSSYIEINHCRRGKFECLYNKNYYAHLCEGDLSINRWSLQRMGDSFPLGYYEGVEILIDIQKARKNELLANFHIDIDFLAKKLTLNDNIYILRSTQQIQHICLEMYEIDKKMKVDYLKIKVLELLLFLSHNDFEMMQNQKRYYPKKQIETIKAIKQYLSEHLSSKINFDVLAKQYHINIHTLRKSFKEIYGVPIYQWFKQCRLEYSMELLRNTDLSIIDIANKVGYSNPSKYSAAFYQLMNMTPQQYRKSFGEI